MKTKTCRTCNITFPLDIEYFYRNSSSKDGFRGDCVICRKAKDKQRYDNNRENILKKGQLYRETNRDEYNANVRKRRKENPERVKEIEKRRHQKHKEKRNAKCRENWAKNKDQYKEQTIKRLELKREVYNEARRKKYINDPIHRAKQKACKQKNIERHYELAKIRWAKAPAQKKIRTYIGAAIAHSLKGRTKGGKGWQEILGYAIKDLIKHLELQFKDGMSWDNYGFRGWHVDHIKPQSMFNYESVDDVEFFECWSLNNLQPLWGEENMSKSNRYIG